MGSESFALKLKLPFSWTPDCNDFQEKIDATTVKSRYNSRLILCSKLHDLSPCVSGAQLSLLVDLRRAQREGL